MKKLTSGQIIVGIVAVFVGLTISVQIYSLDGNVVEGSLIPIQKAQSLAAELAKLKDEREVLMEEYTSLEAKIKEIQDTEAKEDVLIRNVVTELDKYKTISGMRDVKGPGVIITVQDPPTEANMENGESTIMYNYSLLLMLINKLNDAGAEAISINGQRYMSVTEISLAGSNVNINSVPTAPPFIIRAIGNPDTLDATLNIRFGIVDQMRSRYDLQVKIEKRDEIIVPRYNEIIKFRYAVPIEE